MRSFIYLVAGLVMGSGLGTLYGEEVLTRWTAPQNTLMGDAPYRNLSDDRKNIWPADMPAPTIDMDLVPDINAGYNLMLETTNFEMTPEDLNGAPVAGTGHGHLFVNGENWGRIYADMLHLVDLPKGEVTLHVYLGGNDHKVWVVNGEPLFLEETFIIE